MKMKKITALALGVILISGIAACGSGPETEALSEHSLSETAERIITADVSEEEEENLEKSLHLYINDIEIPVIWEQNASVEALAAFAEDAPVTIQMSMYGGFEQVGSLGTSLVSSDVQTTTAAGDIVLYSSSQIVIFYGSNSWAYTRLGRISGAAPEEMAALLGNGNVTVTVSYE